MPTLHPIFTDGAVLQANKPVRIFGEGAGKVTVTLGDTTVTAAPQDGGWLATLPPQPYGGPHTLTVSLDGEARTLTDIHFGDVYLLGGQSNMQFKMHGRMQLGFKDDLRGSEDVRLFTVDRPQIGDRFHPADGWVDLRDDTAIAFSAIGYYLGHALSGRGRKIGLVACYQGASVIQSWLPEEVAARPALQSEEKYHDHAAYPQWNAVGLLYRTMIKKLAPFTFSHILWYQGESNITLGEAEIYPLLLEALIASWRDAFLDPALPFIVIQLADYAPRLRHLPWQMIQTAQLAAETKIPYVRTVISRDICETNDIHPPTKIHLARRIARVLLAEKGEELQGEC